MICSYGESETGRRVLALGFTPDDLERLLERGWLHVDGAEEAAGIAVVILVGPTEEDISAVLATAANGEELPTVSELREQGGSWSAS